MNVIAFVYSGFQAYDLGYHLATGKHVIRHHLRYHFNFFMDQASYLNKFAIYLNSMHPMLVISPGVWGHSVQFLSFPILLPDDVGKQAFCRNMSMT